MRKKSPYGMHAENWIKKKSKTLLVSTHTFSYFCQLWVSYHCQEQADSLHLQSQQQ